MSFWDYIYVPGDMTRAIKADLAEMRAAQVDRSAKRQDPKGLDPEDESAVAKGDAP